MGFLFAPVWFRQNADLGSLLTACQFHKSPPSAEQYRRHHNRSYGVILMIKENFDRIVDQQGNFSPALAPYM
jgi:hypothetical protein